MPLYPPFSKALYYPTIDIRDSTWLKTAILFWDSIYTIVPESINDPYRYNDTSYLASIDYLKPFRVSSDSESVIGIEEDIMNLLDSPRFKESLYTNPKDTSMSGVWASKMSYELRYEIEKYQKHNFGILRPDKKHSVKSDLKKHKEALSDNDKLYYLYEPFAYIYMMALAQKISENNSLAMITDNYFSFETKNNMQLSNYVPILQGHAKTDVEFEQGLLLDFIVRGLSISPDTDLEAILSFKYHHRDELARFKSELKNLTQGLNNGQTFDALHEDISNVYVNSFTPAFNNFKAALKDSRIKWLSDTFLKVYMITVGAAGISMALPGMTVNQAIYAGAGLSVIASDVSYNTQKRQAIRDNPYSYLLSIQKHLN